MSEFDDDDSYALGPEPTSRPEPAPKPAAPQPLPRLHRFTQPEEDEPPARSKPRPRESKPRRPAPPVAAAKPPKEAGDANGKSGVLEEATPTLDTYDTRRRVRMAVGGLAGLIALGALVMVIQAVRGPSQDFEDFPEEELASADPLPGAAAPAVPPPNRSEAEARLAMADARRFAEKGDGELAHRRLQKLVESYPNTGVSKEASLALERASQGLPLFVDVPTVVAQPAPPPAEPTEAPGPAPVVEVAPPAPAATAVVELAPPPTPPEPYRETGLGRPTADVSPLTLPAGFRPRPESGVDPSGWPLEITCDQDGATLVFVPGGAFTMGRDDGLPQERPARRVLLSPFYIDQHEVTVGQYGRFLEQTGHRGRGSLADEAARPADDRPVTQVSFDDARRFASWAGKELPTEAQWEMAARTIDGRIHPWGPGPASWDAPRQPGAADPVASHALDLSPYGAFDLAGNVREWTSDYFRFIEGSTARGPAAVNPRVTDPGKARSPLIAIKGGAADWTCSWREGMRPDARQPNLGFRCALPLPVEAPVSPEPAPMPELARPEGPAPAPVPPGGAVPF